MAQFPAMPLWTDAYLGDTVHLTTIEHGAYLLLLMCMWRAKSHTLPDDDKLLARYTKLGPQQWLRIKKAIQPFFRIENGTWSNDRLLDEYATILQQRESRSNTGRANVLKRYNRDLPTVGLKSSIGIAPTPTLIRDSNQHSGNTEPALPKNQNIGKSGTANSLSLFEKKFWPLAIRKVDKPRARKSFNAACKRAPPEIIIEAFRLANLAWTSWDRQFVPHPSTWLTGDRWQDEPPEPRSKPNGRQQPESYAERTARVIARLDREGPVPALAVDNETRKSRK